MFNNDGYSNMNFLFFHFNLKYFSVKLKKDMFFDFNDVNFNVGLSLLK